MISFITCSANSIEVPILRTSIANRIKGKYEIICTVGEKNIGIAYNKGAYEAKGDILVFTHEDVEIRSTDFDLEQASMCAYLHGVIGVAGARVLPDNLCWWATQEKLSGACLHTKNNEIWMSTYGKFGEVEVLDGVFLMCHRKTFQLLHGFDENIPGWDFYDIDFTLRSIQQGLKNFTYPIMVCHHSLGEGCKEEQWQENRLLIANRLHNGYYNSK